MGWLLIQNGTQRKLHLRPGKVQVGRAQTAQVKATHQSVSRIHAEIVVESCAGPLSEVRPLPICIIDNSSTGHTFVNGKASPGKGVPRPLVSGDLLSFGVDPVTFRVAWSPVVLSYSSRVSPQEVQALEGLARAAGVFLTPDWTLECTHLVIEQLAITPKLLCCIADGGIPVSASFLHALARCSSADVPPDPRSHRPHPLLGVDAEYSEELATFLESPRPRRTMLERVCVVFGLRQAFDALSVPLRHSGAQLQVVCTSEEQVPQAAEDLRRGLAAARGGALGVPQAIWLVPGLDDATLAALLPLLRDLGAPCLALSHKAVVGGILSGSLEIAHAAAAAVPLGHGGAEGSFPQTQQPFAVPSASAPPASAASLRAAGADARLKVKEEDSFPSTLTPQQPQQLHQLQQPQQPQQLPPRQRLASPAVSQPQPSLVMPSQGLSMEGAMPPPAKRLRQAAVQQVKEQQESQEKPELAAKPEARGEPPMTLSSDCGSAPKEEKKEEDKEALGRRLAEAPGAAASFAFPGGPQAHCSISETPAASQTKLERGASVKEEEPAEPAPAAEPERPPVVHTSGDWLASLCNNLRSRPQPEPGSELCTVDGVRFCRPTWCPGAAAEVPISRPAAAAAAGGRSGRGRRPTGGPNFKLFRKADGQRQAGCTEVVAVAPWVPAARAGLSEAFGSQPLGDSDSQALHLPPGV